MGILICDIASDDISITLSVCSYITFGKRGEMPGRRHFIKRDVLLLYLILLMELNFRSKTSRALLFHYSICIIGYDT